jgi:hypothetical protein
LQNPKEGDVLHKSKELPNTGLHSGMEIEKDEYLHDLFTNSPKPVIHP